MDRNKIDTLIGLYSKASKHSNYQTLPSNLSALLDDDLLQIKSRSEIERLCFILEKISVRDKIALDIGANTGFFSFELIDKGAKSVTAYEGNKAHADFMKFASDLIDVSHRLEVVNAYYDFTENSKNSHKDITLLLNVLHHVGSDYSDSQIDMHRAKELILTSINNLSSITTTLVLQVGFNWHGDIKKPLFINGTKKEMIEFITDGTKSCWEISFIGIAESIDGNIIYCDLNESNIARNDTLGEFLNRPVFIMKSKNERTL